MENNMIAKLESKGFSRWTKGNMDRLYINAQHLGYEPETAAAMPKLNGESISRSEARRIVNAKTYIDLKDDTLHSDGYWNNNLKDAAQALIDEAAAEIEAEEKAEAEQDQAVEETEAEEAPEVTEEETMESTIKVNQEYLDTVARPECYWHYDSNEGINKGSWGDFWKVEMSLTNIITGEKMTNVINVLKDETDTDDGKRIDSNIWYAVQENSEDTWDYGSHNFDEAKLMLKDQGYGLIAVIENGDFCKEEILYTDLF